MEVFSGQIPATGKFGEKQLETRLGELIFQMSGVGLCTPANLRLAKIQLTKVDRKTGQKEFLPKIDLYTLFELTAHHEGHFQQSNDAAFGMVDLTPFGSLELNSSEYLSLSGEGFQDTLQLDIFTQEEPHKAEKALKYETNHVPVGTAPKDVNLGSVVAIAMPTGEVDYVEITYANGKTIRKGQAELTAEQLKRDNVIATSSLTGGTITMNYIDYFYIEVSDAVSMRYKPEGSNAHEIYLVREVTA